MYMKTRKLTMGQAVVKFLEQQFVERDGNEIQFFAGMFGIFGARQCRRHWTGVASIRRLVPFLPDAE